MLLGPSGAGKNSLLRRTQPAGDAAVSSLSIAGNQFDFTRAPSDKAIRELRQNVGMVFPTIQPVAAPDGTAEPDRGPAAYWG